MDEGFDFHILWQLPPHFRKLCKGQLPGRHHPASPQGRIDPCGGGVGAVGLGAYVNGHLRRGLMKDPHHPGVGDDNAVDSHVLQLQGIGGERFQFFIPGKGVDGDVYFAILAVGFPCGAANVLQREGDFFRPQLQRGASEIHRVRAVSQGDSGRSQVSGGGQQFIGHGFSSVFRARNRPDWQMISTFVIHYTNQCYFDKVLLTGGQAFAIIIEETLEEFAL